MPNVEQAEYWDGAGGDVSEDVAAAAWDSVRAALVPYAGPDGVVLGGAAWIVTATKPG